MASKEERIRKEYNAIAETYLAWLQQRPTLHDEKLNQLLEHLTPQSKVLELGCGAGLPITKTLTERVAEVVANDISDKQIELAKRNAPKARYIEADMITLELEEHEYFDAVVGFYCFFHIQREDHQALLIKIHSWLKKDGLLLFTHSIDEEDGDWLPFLGGQLFYSSSGVDKTVKLVKDSGFEIIQSEVRAQGDVEDPNDPDNGVSFLWVFARKK